MPDVVELDGFVFTDHFNPHLSVHPLQVVVESARGFRGGEHFVTSLQVGFGSPVAWSTPHRYAGQQ